MSDAEYIIQGLYSDGTTIAEEDEAETAAEAKSRAFDMLHSPTFEGSSVRVITRDGENVTKRIVAGTASRR